MEIRIGDLYWELGLGIVIGDLGLTIEIGDRKQILVLGSGIEIEYWNLGMGHRIGIWIQNWDWGSIIGLGDLTLGLVIGP